METIKEIITIKGEPEYVPLSCRELTCLSVLLSCRDRIVVVVAAVVGYIVPLLPFSGFCWARKDKKNKKARTVQVQAMDD